MRSRLELKAAARRERVADKVTRQSFRMERDPDAPVEDVPILKIGKLRIATQNRATDRKPRSGVRRRIER